MPGRPAEATILSFILIATAGIGALGRSYSARKILTSAGLAISLVGGIAAVGHALNAPAMYHAINGISNGMAIHTALLFVIAGVTLVALAKAQRGVASPQPSSDRTAEYESIGLSIRTKVTSMLLTATVIPILFVGGITLSNSASLAAELLAGSIVILGFATAVSVVFFAFSMAHYMLSPLLLLRQAIHEVAKGNYNAGITIDSTDEIGSLASDFEHMKK